MLGLFLSPYPDELFSSLIARYHQKLSFLKQPHLTLNLFGRKKILSCAFPSHLGRLCENLSVNTSITPHWLIENHTLFPLYRPFFSIKKANKFEKYMMGFEEGTTINTCFWTYCSDICALKYLKYCKLCIKSDRELYGDAYWHRAHQLLGVKVCHKHHIALSNSKVDVLSNNIFEYSCALEAAYQTEEGNVDDKNVSILDCYIADSTKFLLDAMIPECGPKIIIMRYHSILKKHGYLSSHDIDWSSRLSDFKCSHSMLYSLLSILRCISAYDDDRLTIDKISEFGDKYHPLQHVLFMKLFNINLYDFFREDISGCESFATPNAFFGETAH